MDIMRLKNYNPNATTMNKLLALRFIAWIQKNQNNVVCFPPAKSLILFVAWTKHFLITWDHAETQAIFQKHAVDGTHKPNLSKLCLVQAYEIIETNLCYDITKRLFIDELGLDAANCLFITSHTISQFTPK